MTSNLNLRTPDNGKKVSKFFRIGVEGDTCDGRIISGNDIQEMAESFDLASTVAALTLSIFAVSFLMATSNA